MSPPDQIVVFDFDGVISNSIHDSYITALNAYIELVPNHTFPLRRPIQPPGKIFAFEKNHPDLLSRFSDLIPMARRAEHYFVLMYILDRKEETKIRDQNDFNDYDESIPETMKNSYRNLFYRIRRNLQEKDTEVWAKLLPIFPGMTEAIRMLSSRFILAISTAKDRISVNLLLEKYGLTSCFKPEHILDKESGESKRDHILHLRQIHSVPFERIHFIDDKVSHLVSVKDLRVGCYLALWGFNTEREHVLAKKEGFTLISLSSEWVFSSNGRACFLS